MAATTIKSFCCFLATVCLMMASDVLLSTYVSATDVSSSTDVTDVDLPSSSDFAATDVPSSKDVFPTVSAKVDLLPASCTPVTVEGSSLSPEEFAQALATCYVIPSMSFEGSDSEFVVSVTPSAMLEPSTRTESPTSGDVMSSMTISPWLEVSSSVKSTAMIMSHTSFADISETPTVTPSPQDMMTFQPSVSSTSHDTTDLNERSSLFPEGTSSIDNVTPSTLETASMLPSPATPPQNSETPSSSPILSSPVTSLETGVTSSGETVSTSAGVAVTTTSTTGTVSGHTTAETVATELSSTTLQQNLQMSSTSAAQSSTDTSLVAAVTSSTHDASTSAGVSESTTSTSASASTSVGVSVYGTTSTHETTSSSSHAQSSDTSSTSLTQLFTDTSLATAVASESASITSGVAVTSSATDTTSWNVRVSSAEATSASSSTTNVQSSESSSTSAAQSSTGTSLATSVTSSTYDTSTNAVVAVSTTSTFDATASVPTVTSTSSSSTLSQISETSSSHVDQSSTNTLPATTATSSTQDVTASVSVAATTTPPTVAASTNGTDSTPETPSTTSLSTTLTHSSETSSHSVAQSATDTSATTTMTSSQSATDTSATTTVTSSHSAADTSATTAMTSSQSNTDTSATTTVTSPQSATDTSATTTVSSSQSTTDTSATTTVTSPQSATDTSATTTVTSSHSAADTSATTAMTSSQSNTDTSATTTVTSPQSATDTSATTTVSSSQSTTDTSATTTVTSPQSAADTSATTAMTSSQSNTDTSATTTVTSPQSATDTSATTTVSSSQSTTDTSATTTVTSPQSATDTSATTTVTSPQSATDTSATTTVTSSQSTTETSATPTVTSPQSATDTSATTTVTSPQSTTDTSATTTVTLSQSTTETSATTTVTLPQSTTETSATTTVTSSQSTTDTSATTTLTSSQSTTDTSAITTLTSSSTNVSTSTAGAETTTSTTVVVSMNGTTSRLETTSTTSMSSSLNDSSSTQPPNQTSSSSLHPVSTENSTAVSSTSSSDVLINSSLVEDCYSAVPSSQLKELYDLMQVATCAGRQVLKFGGPLGNLTFPLLAIPDVKAILSRNATWASPTKLSGFNSSVNCNAFDFGNSTDAAILSVVGAELMTGMRAFKLSLDEALTNATSCITSHTSKAAADVYANELDEISRAYKNITSLLKVYADSVLAALQQVTGCSGLTDCNGVCGGKAKFDWECRVCYGGDTSYKITFAGDLKDCDNTCLGKAFVESCTGTCVGGNTGRRAEDYVDCAGICLGPNIRDSCNICVANTSLSRSGSQFMDCTGKCFVRANMSSMAVNNSCGVCVLGDTGRPSNSGMDVCGVCNGDNSTCLDCHNVTNGGSVRDACGECGGNGTKCLTVTSVSPGVVPSGVQKVVVVTGAGFNASLDTCVAEGRETGGNQTLFSRATDPPDSITRLTLTLPSTLAADSYTIKCRLSGGSYAESTAVVTVYNSSVATASSVSKTNFTISPPSQEFIEFQGSGFMSNSTFCKFTDSSGGVKFVVATVLNGSSATCSLTHPEASERYTVQLTFNQLDQVGPSFTVTAFAPAPIVTANLSDNGDKVQVFFSPAVNLQQGSACSDIFSSVASLGPSAVCTVVSRQLVYITDSTVRPGSFLVLKDDTIRAHGQRFPQTAAGTVNVTSPSNPVTPHVVLTGPDVVSSCTKSFTVDGRRSTGLGGRAGNYSWHVDQSSGLTLDGSTSSVLTVSNHSAGQRYNLTLTLCNFLGQCHAASHTVEQTANNAPDVVIETFADITKVKPSDRLMLAAKATLYPNCADDQVVFRWTFDTTFEVNTDYITRAVYTIDPYLLPVPATIVASVRASLATNDSASNTASVTITTVLSDLDAKIQGADVRTIGVDSGYFALDATQSLDPDGLAGDITYIWTCAEMTDHLTSCLDKSSHVMPNSSQKSQGLLTLSSADLEVGKKYLLTVTVGKKSQGTSRFASASVTVLALAGDPPRVQLNLFNGNRGRYSVDEMVTMAAELTASSPVTIDWTSYESSDYGYVNLSDSAVVGSKQEPLLVDSATNTYVAFLTIRGGVLSRGTMYRVQCQVTAANQSATSAVSFYVRRGVTSCKFSIEGGSYTELGALRGKVEQCDTDQDGQPMTFDFYVMTDAGSASVKRLTKPSSLGQLDIPYGPKAYLTGGNNFTVQVCATLGGCTWFYTSFVTVTAISSDSLTTIKTTIIKAAKDLRKSGNPLDGILSLATYLQSQLSSRSRRSTDIQTPDVNGLVIDLANDTLRTMYPSETVMKTLMDGLASVPPATLSDQDLLRMLAMYEEIATGYGASDVSAMSLEQVGQIKRFENYLVNTRALPTSQNLSLILTAAWRKSLAFGTKAEIDTEKGTLAYFVQTLSSTEASRSSSSPVWLDFGDTLNKRYNRWNCGSSQCLGVGVEVFHYSTNTYPNLPSDTTPSADVITLTLFNQNSGAEISNITNLDSPVTLTFPLVQPKGAPYLCKYWDPTSGTWRTEGVSTDLQTADTVVCKATHLTDFTVVSDSSSSSNNAALIGGVVGGILGALFLVVIVVIVVFYFKKQNRVGSTPSLRRVLVTSKRDESASTQNLQVREEPDIGQQTDA